MWNLFRISGQYLSIPGKTLVSPCVRTNESKALRTIDVTHHICRDQTQTCILRDEFLTSDRYVKIIMSNVKIIFSCLYLNFFLFNCNTSLSYSTWTSFLLLSLTLHFIKSVSKTSTSFKFLAMTPHLYVFNTSFLFLLYITFLCLLHFITISVTVHSYYYDCYTSELWL